MKKSVGRMVSILYRRHVVYMNDVLKEVDITSSEQPILMYLYSHEGVTQEEITKYLSIDKGSTARNIHSLINKGFVRREKNSVDKRCNVLLLTEKGWSIEKKMKKKLQRWSDFLTEDLDPETERLLFEGLEQMVEKLEGIDLRNEV
ncbi:MarR family winged helix-turn-helix transcriptional regulator [Enterococcus rivorum]|uniref:HTH marR-type domain-containing protein n=1 Tax=Enterococcus rivorum TaxID=762845 RepID=A0A1E5L035_9ENTE|nr:MarR family winged helix-turn-helix transcriptional regulator [Enterococcus rivorum]MBP2100222.1 DNA-binding MarR family transcriptional regulator [Enterococcus rivorum]OEH83443.1 hypothetical protein BCR26_09685 [Enterococcus rivorum]